MPRDPVAIPRLTSDVRRSVVCLIPGLILVLVLSPVIFTESVMDSVVGPVGAGMLGWSFFAAGYCVLTLWAFRGLRGELFRRSLVEAESTEPRAVRRVLRVPGARVMLTGGEGPSWSAQVSVVALAAALLLSVNAQVRSDPALLLVGIGTVVTSWFTVLVSYALHYARAQVRAGGLRFPGEEPDGLADFLYFAAAVSTTFGTSDVTVETARMRRVVTGHGLLAFAFNTVIVAIVVAILVGTLA
ncbi:DUF1345 domain-containing protein [Occultella glacieicola]|uniref:DUF1345 domain-containing protein n=1 Tax=Occultella glacieicola TaxID=2518684 RepID=A0ABY2E1Y5_9MICO|nr:DUF1345 domain-containing protein [Occultella glacieicola]TDE90392.1 DUF1345 domain-containing protein [Occultella glacieicola]